MPSMRQFVPAVQCPADGRGKLAGKRSTTSVVILDDFEAPKPSLELVDAGRPAITSCTGESTKVKGQETGFFEGLDIYPVEVTISSS
jgi:hypothetical protein